MGLFDDITGEEDEDKKLGFFDDVDIEVPSAPDLSAADMEDYAGLGLENTTTATPDEGYSLKRFGGQFVEGAKDLARQGAKGYGVTADQLSGVLGKIPSTPLSPVRMAQSFYEGAADVAPKVAAVKPLQQDPEYQQSAGFWEDVVRTGPQVLAQMGAGVATGPAIPMLMMGSQIAGSTYENEVAKGVDPDRAAKAGVANAIMQAPLESLGLNKALKLFGTRSAVVKKLKDMGAALGTEFVTEFLQSYPDSAATIWAEGADKDSLEKVGKFVDDFWETTKKGIKEGLTVLPFAGLGMSASLAQSTYHDESTKRDAAQVSANEINEALFSDVNADFENAPPAVDPDKPEFLGGKEAAMPGAVPAQGPDTPEFLGGDFPVQENDATPIKMTVYRAGDRPPTIRVPELGPGDIEAAYFAETEDIASGYLKDHSEDAVVRKYEVYLQNPANVEDLKSVFKDIGLSFPQVSDAVEGRMVRDELIERGFDSVVTGDGEVLILKKESLPGYVQEKGTAPETEQDAEFDAEEDAGLDAEPDKQPDIPSYPTGKYAAIPKSPYGVALPDAVELVRELNEGKVPKVVQEMKERGKFTYNKDSSDLAVRGDLAIGERIDEIAARPKRSNKEDPDARKAEEKADLAKKYEAFKQQVQQQSGLTPDALTFKAVYNKRTGDTNFRAYRKDPTITTKVLTHELGHWDQWFPDKARIKGHLANFISKIKGGVAGMANEPGLSTPAQREVINKELRALTQKWKPFEAVELPPKGEKRKLNEMERYTKYRYADKELYADAVSVMLNDPVMLRQVAPTFAKAMDNYADARPEFSEALNGLLDRYAQGPEATADYRLQQERERDARGNKILADAQRSTVSKVKGLVDTALSWFGDKNQAALKPIRKQEKSQDADEAQLARDARYDLEELQYISSEAGQYLHSTIKGILEPLMQRAITVGDFGLFMKYRHIIANRKEILSSGGYSGQDGTAQANLDAIRRSVGDENFAAMDEAFKKFREVREQYILPLLRKSGIVTPEMMKAIDERREYAHMSVQDKWEKMFGANTTGRFYIPVGGKLHRQKGSLADVMNPFIATVMQDMSLIRAANINLSKTSLMDMAPAAPAEMKFDAGTKRLEAQRPADPNKAILTVLRDGKPVDYVVDKSVADLYAYAPFEATVVTRIAQQFLAPLRKVLVSRNPVWMIRNLFRDVRAMMKNLPEARLKNLPMIARAYKEGYGEMWRDVWKSDRSQDIKDMYQRKMLTQNRIFGTKEENYDDEMMRLHDEFQIEFNPELNKQAEKSRNLLKRGVRHIWDDGGAADKMGRISDLGAKVAGFKFLNRMRDKGFVNPKTGKPRTDEEIAHIVRTRVGTPDYKRQGQRVAHAITNNLFMFSNVNKEGLRSAWESFKEDKSAYVVKTVMYNILPKLVLLAAASQNDKLRHLLDNLTDYQKSHYTVIPLWLFDDDDTTMALLLPEDYEGQFWGNLTYKAMNGKFTGKDGVLATAAEQLPYPLPGKLNPLAQVGYDWIDYYVSGNTPYDGRRNAPIMPEDIADQGGWPALWQMLAYSWNNLGPGSYFKFNQNELDREKAGAIRDGLRIFPFTAVPGALMTITNRGRAEKYRNQGEELRQEAKAQTRKARTAIEQFINDRGYDAPPVAQGELYRTLLKDGTLPPTYSFKQFRTWFSAIKGHGKDEPRIAALSYASSNKEKGALLALYEQELDAERFNEFTKDMLRNGLISVDSIVEKAKYQKEKN